MHCCFRSVNVKIITGTEKTAVTHLPGFKYDDFDRAGRPIICGCLHLLPVLPSTLAEVLF